MTTWDRHGAQVTGRPDVDVAWSACCTVGKSRTSVNDSGDLVSGIASVVDRLRQDAYDGDFDEVLERHSLQAVAVTAHVHDPAFLCQPGSVLRQQICGTLSVECVHGIVS